MMTHEQMKAEMLEDPKIRHYYEHPDQDMIELDLRIKARMAGKKAKRLRKR